MTTTTTVERPKSRATLANLAAGERFAKTTEDHQLTVLHDQGPYKHLLFKEPNTSWYWYELVVWPGNLTISGDMGTWTFCRDTDMLRFFRTRHPHGHDYRINADYWAEKLQGGMETGRTLAREYDKDLLIDHLVTLVRERAEDAGLREEDLEAVLEHLDLDLTRNFGETGNAADEQTDLEAAREYKHTQDFTHRDDDPCDGVERFVVEFDWDDVYDCGPFHGYDNRFLWCLHAIVSGIETYDRHVAAIA